MKTFDITLVISHPESDDEKLLTLLFESGCDDATMSVQRGARILDFDREAQTYTAALQSACTSVMAIEGKVVRIEPDNLVTMADIAKRLDRSRQAVSQYVAGTRRESFPAPVARVTAENPLWDWVQVLEWFAQERDPAATNDLLVEARAIKRATEMRTQPVLVGIVEDVVTASIPINKVKQEFGISSPSKRNTNSLLLYENSFLSTYTSQLGV